MRLRPWVRFGLFVGVVAGLLLMAAELLSVDPAHARTVEEPLELATASADATAAPPVDGDVDPVGGASDTFLIVIALALVLAVGGGYLVWRRRAVDIE